MSKIEEQIAREPWMENFRDQMRLTCHDCGVQIGKRHVEGCDCKQVGVVEPRSRSRKEHGV